MDQQCVACHLSCSCFNHSGLHLACGGPIAFSCLILTSINLMTIRRLISKPLFTGTLQRWWIYTTCIYNEKYGGCWKWRQVGPGAIGNHWTRDVCHTSGRNMFIIIWGTKVLSDFHVCLSPQDAKQCRVKKRRNRRETPNFLLHVGRK